MTVRRLICAVIGHRKGQDLYGYVYPEDQDAQRHGRTYSIGLVGYECRRCHARIKA